MVILPYIGYIGHGIDTASVVDLNTSIVEKRLMAPSIHQLDS